MLPLILKRNIWSIWNYLYLQNFRLRWPPTVSARCWRWTRTTRGWWRSMRDSPPTSSNGSGAPCPGSSPDSLATASQLSRRSWKSTESTGQYSYTEYRSYREYRSGCKESYELLAFDIRQFYLLYSTTKFLQTNRQKHNFLNSWYYDKKLVTIHTY